MKFTWLPALLRFGLVGVGGLLVDLAVLYVAAPNLGWYGARVLSFWAAATATWWFNRHYTFASATAAATAAESVASVGRQYLRYLLSMMLGGSVNYLTYATVIVWWTGPAAPAVGVALGSCAGLVFNFVAAKYFIFRQPAKNPEAHS